MAVSSGVAAQNPIITDRFTADPAPIVHRDTVFLYVGEDTTAAGGESYQMPHWRVYSSTDMATWKDRGVGLVPTDFSWSSGGAFAAQVIERNGKFYWYVSLNHKRNNESQGGVAIGVAVSDSPVGPFKDPVGKALITNEMTTDMKHSWDDLDPSVFIDDDGQAYLFWGNGTVKYIKLKENMVETEGEITTFKPKNFTEAPWLYKRNDIYYLFYAANMPETIEYATAKSIHGPWEYGGLVQSPVKNSFTTHPGVIDYHGKTYFFYHNGVLPTGGGYRRSVCVDYLYFNDDGSVQKVIETTEGVKPVKR